MALGSSPCKALETRLQSLDRFMQRIEMAACKRTTSPARSLVVCSGFLRSAPLRGCRWKYKRGLNVLELKRIERSLLRLEDWPEFCQVGWERKACLLPVRAFMLQLDPRVSKFGYNACPMYLGHLPDALTTLRLRPRMNCIGLFNYLPYSSRKYLLIRPWPYSSCNYQSHAVKGYVSHR